MIKLRIKGFIFHLFMAFYSLIFPSDAIATMIDLTLKTDHENKKI